MGPTCRTARSRADFTGAAVAGGNFSYCTGFHAQQLYSTADYQAGSLAGIALSGNNMAGWSFAGQDFTGAKPKSAAANASFNSATLTVRTLPGATVTGADFGSTTGNGIYGTTALQHGELPGQESQRASGYLNNDLTGWNFAGQNLANASFNSAPRLRARTLPGRRSLERGSVRPPQAMDLRHNSFTARRATRSKNLSGIGLSNNDSTGGTSPDRTWPTPASTAPRSMGPTCRTARSRRGLYGGRGRRRELQLLHGIHGPDNSTARLTTKPGAWRASP